jgi:hypothetical protein
MSTEDTGSGATQRTTPEGVHIEDEDAPESLQSTGTSTKYGSQSISTETDDEEGETADENKAESDEQTVSQAVSLATHTIDIIVDDELDPDSNEDRTKYSVCVKYPENCDGPVVSHVMVYHWEAQTRWLEEKVIDWRDARATVREKTTPLVADADGPRDLQSPERLIEEGGESPY